MFSFKTISAVSIGFALPLQALALAGGADNQKRELSYAMRQLYAREVYTIDPTPNPPSCASGYDSVDPSTGACDCGEGRVQVTPETCGVANGGGEFRVTELTSPQAINRPITWSSPFTGPGDVLNAPQCGGICSQDGDCIGYYLQPAEGNNIAYCWLLGGDDVYDSPSNTGLPFTPSSSRMVKRAPGVTGTLGVAGGQLGIAAAVNDANPTVGCVADLGDVANEDLTGCTCGPGRINNAQGDCIYPASIAARMARRVKRDTYEGVPW